MKPVRSAPRRTPLATAMLAIRRALPVGAGPWAAVIPLVIAPQRLVHLGRIQLFAVDKRQASFGHQFPHIGGPDAQAFL